MPRLFFELSSRFKDRRRHISVPFVQTAITISLGLAFAFQTASLIWALVTPVGPVGDWRPATIASAAKAQTGTETFDPFFRLQSGASATAVVTPLALKLSGVRIDSAMGRGSAFITTPDGIQSSYAVGDQIMPDVTLKSVAFDNVTIDRGGMQEQIFLDQSGTTPAVNTGTPAASSAGFQAAVMAVPRMTGGTVTGLTLSPKGDGVKFAAAGLQAGDVLVSVGGKPVTDAAALSQITPGAGGIVTLQVERGGRTIALSANITA